MLNKLYVKQFQFILLIIKVFNASDDQAQII